MGIFALLPIGEIKMKLTKEEMILCANLLFADAKDYEQIKEEEKGDEAASFNESIKTRKELAERFLDEIAKTKD